MTPSINWTELLEARRARAGEPDEASLQRQVERWKHLLAKEENLPDAVLDDELVSLLESIHHAR